MCDMYKNFFKRAIDILIGLMAMPFLLIILVVFAPLIYLTDRGPVFYNAPRVGKNGKVFKMYKLRSMYVNAPDIRNADGSTYNAADDPRVTKIGKLMRKTSVDEFPQFLNVLLGDMSFVGPRPERRYFIEKIRKENPNYDYVYLMRPGLTSMATLHNGYTDTMEKMLKRLDMDLEYLQKRSLWLDAKLIFTTFLYIVNGKKF